MSETGPQGQPDDALVDLLIKQVTEGLSPAEQRALDALDSPSATQTLAEFERAAAAISLAGAGPLQAPPPALLARLEQQAASYAAAHAVVAPPTAVGAAARSDVAPGIGVGAGPGIATATVSGPVGGRGRVPAGANPLAAGRPRRSGGSLGWFAAAACLVLAVIGWMRSSPTEPPPVVHVPETPAMPPAVPAAPLTPSEERVALLAAPTTLKITLGATKDPGAAGVTGDVVWDPAAQKGFLHFAGLKPNDPSVMQYQIWIFDGERDKRYPIDGGVFDVPANAADIVIPIRAAVLVHKPAAFAVTAEKPGGVVVSDRAHLIVLGAAG
jgi:hypothetical protein